MYPSLASDQQLNYFNFLRQGIKRQGMRSSKLEICWRLLVINYALFYMYYKHIISICTDCKVSEFVKFNWFFFCDQNDVF
jgi:hypothetical protein